MSPSLSVIIPAYKVESYLRECLASIESQTLADWECIVIDDGSPDDGYRIAEEFAARDARFRLIRTENQGLGPARNLGATQAQGRFLTFVDSDDIVPPRAYSLMTAVLEETGSDFAAGNARRFDGPDGVTQSWSHAGVFSKTRLGTHINATPALIRDRMAWNKVYRRDFWASAGLEFPAIRYEDYPVSMQAHLSARAVDIVSTHIYYWRQRGSGDSITQSLFEIDNLEDRVTSALQTLDVLEAEAPASVTGLAYEYFIDIDLVVFARALVQSAPEDVAAIEALGVRLAERLRPQRRSSGPLGDVIHEAFLRGDLALVRAMARWRDGEGVAGLRTELPLIPRPSQARPLFTRAMPKASGLSDPRRPRKLRSELVSMDSSGDSSTLVVDVRLRRQLAHRAAVEVFLEVNGQECSLSHRAEPTATGLRITVEVRLADLEQNERFDSEGRLGIRLKLGGLTWRGTVDANPALVSGPLLATGVAYQWTAPRGHGLMVRRLGRANAASVSAEGDEFVLSHPLLDGPSICVDRPFPTDAAAFSTSGYESRIAAQTLLADPPDEPVSGVAERRVHLDRFAEQSQLLLVGESAAIIHGDRRVELGRDGWGFLVVRHSPAQMDLEDSAAAAAEVEDHDASGGHVPSELAGSTPAAAEQEIMPTEP